LKKTLTDSSADLNARRTALDSLLGPHDTTLPRCSWVSSRTATCAASHRALAGYDDPKTPARS